MPKSWERHGLKPWLEMQDRLPPTRRKPLATHGRTSAARLAAIPAGESPANRDAMGRAARTMAPSSLQRINGAPHATAERFEQIPHNSRTRCNTDSRDRDGQSSWLVAGIVPGVERQPLKKLAVDESALLKLLNRWREEAEQAGHRIKRIAVAFEAGRDGFWLARNA